MEELKYLLNVLENNLKELKAIPIIKYKILGIPFKVNNYKIGEIEGKIETLENTIITVKTMMFRISR